MRFAGRGPLLAGLAAAVLAVSSCTTAPTPVPSVSTPQPTATSSSPTAGIGPAPSLAPGPLFGGQTIAYAVPGFKRAEVNAIRLSLAAPVVGVFSSESQLRTSGRGESIPVATLYADADAYAAAAGRPELAAQLRSGVVLAASEALLRHKKVGDLLTFSDGASLPITAVVDDHDIAGFEIASSHATLRPPVTQRIAYILIGGSDPLAALTKKVRAAVASTRLVRVETSTANGFLSSVDTVLTQLQMKKLFGEFAVRPLKYGVVAPDSRWEASHIVDRRIVQLGIVTCNRAVVADLRAAMVDITRRHLDALVHTADFQYEGGCYNPAAIPFSAGGSLSAHTWAIAVDINVDVNPLGDRSRQDPRLVAIMRAHNFTWGGRWLRPDAAHFEWVGPTVRH